MEKSMGVAEVTDKELPQYKESDGAYENMQTTDGTLLKGDYIKTGPVINKSDSISAKNLPVEYPKKEIPIPVKPVSVRLEDFRKNLNEVVAGSELPPFLSVMVLREMLMAINPIAERECAQDQEEWEKACEEWERICKEKEGEKDG